MACLPQQNPGQYFMRINLLSRCRDCRAQQYLVISCHWAGGQSHAFPECQGWNIGRSYSWVDMKPWVHGNSRFKGNLWQVKIKAIYKDTQLRLSTRLDFNEQILKQCKQDIIWGFPQIGVPPIIHFNGIFKFSFLNHPLGGTTHLWKPSIKSPAPRASHPR